MPLRLSQLKDDEYQITARKGGGNKVGSFIKGAAVGAMKAGLETGVGAGEIGRTIQKTINPFGERALGGTSVFDKGSAPNTAARKQLKAEGPGQGTGKFVGAALQYLLPTGAVTRGQKLLSRVLPTMAGRAAARAIPEAVGTGAVSMLRTGGDAEQAKNEALMAGGASVGLGVLGRMGRATYWPQLEETVSKALGVQGKVSGGQAFKQLGQKVSGFGVLKERAPNLTVTLDDGVKGTFDPTKATYDTTLQAWNEARKQIYTAYSGLTKKAGETASIDLTPVREALAGTLGDARLGAYKTAAKSLINDIDTGFEDITRADMRKVEKLLDDLNANTVAGFFKGTADNASAEINAGTARTIRGLLDDIITESTGEQYGALRSEYAALKSIEDDLVRRFRQNARQIGGGLTDYMNMFSSGEVVAGVLSANPSLIAQGATKGLLGAIRKKLADPERFLRRSFELIDKDDASELMVRLFGGSTRTAP